MGEGIRLQPGKKPCTRDSIPIGDNVILKEKNFMVKAVICDHNIPSVAYALLFQPEITVRKDRLKTMDVPAGPWLGTLMSVPTSMNPIWFRRL